MNFLIRSIFESLALIGIGGFFILTEVCLGMRKADFEKIFSLRPPRPALRLLAIFFFILAVLCASENIFDLLVGISGLERTFFLVLLSIALALFLLFFGIILPRVIGESCASSWLVYGISRLLYGLTAWMDPFVFGFHSLVVQTLKGLGLSLPTTPSTSDEEVMHMMDEGLHSGVFNAAEKEMVEGVLELDEQCAASLMTPRSHMVALNLDDKKEENWRRIISSGHSEFPVFQTTQDNIVGIISIKALWANLSLTGKVKLADVLATPLYLSSTMTASAIIEEFREKKRHTALVVNEFGVVVGIITLNDVIESIVGALPEREVRSHYPQIIAQANDNWLVDAMFDYEEAREQLEIPSREEGNEENRYQTIGGFFLHHLGHIPHAGESIVFANFRFQVLSMKHHRIDKLSVTLLPVSEQLEK